MGCALNDQLSGALKRAGTGTGDEDFTYFGTTKCQHLHRELQDVVQME
jgi:hypothetical protein